MTFGSTASPLSAAFASKIRIAVPKVSTRIAARRVPSGDHAGKANVASPGRARTTVWPTVSTSDRDPSLPTTATAPADASLRPGGSDAFGPGAAAGRERAGVGTAVGTGWSAGEGEAARATADGLADGEGSAGCRARFGTIQTAAAIRMIAMAR